MDTDNKGRKTLILNILFIACSIAILLFLLKAPPETTTRLPHDEIHRKFQSMEKKAAEKHCESCHFPAGVAPLPADHPPKYRCLFCHKQGEK
jgi:cytochrome c553